MHPRSHVAFMIHVCEKDCVSTIKKSADWTGNSKCQGCHVCSKYNFICIPCVQQVRHPLMCFLKHFIGFNRSPENSCMVCVCLNQIIFHAIQYLPGNLCASGVIKVNPRLSFVCQWKGRKLFTNCVYLNSHVDLNLI